MKRLALLLLFLLTAFASPLGAQTGAPEVGEVRFVGNESFADGALANAIVTRRSECRSRVFAPFCWFGAEWARDPYHLDERMLRRDEARLQLFYYQRGYREVTVDTEIARPEDENRVRITFRIAEGRPVRVDSLTFEGLASLSDTAPLLEALPLRSGDPLNGILLDAMRDSLRSRLRNRGYAHAEVLRSYFIPRDDPYSGRVSYELHPGPTATVGPMTVVGNQSVSETVVRRMLPFQEGDLFRQNLIFEAQRNLYNLEIFRHAEITADLEHVPDTVVPLRIQVNEGNVHRVRTGAGWNNADCANAESRWTSRNFFGGARRLQVRGRISNVLAPELHDSICNESGSGAFGRLNWLVSTDFNQPWIFSPRNSFSASLYAERQSLKDIFIQEAVGVDLSLSRQVGRRQRLTLSYEPQLSTLDAAELFFCTSFLVCEPEDIGVLEGANWLSPLSLGYSRERTNRLLDPTRGYTLQVEVEHASAFTGSDFSYDRAVGEVSRYVPLGADVVLAGHLRAGWTDPSAFGELIQSDGIRVVHPQKRFFAGGSNSVRGYAQNRLGPKNLSVPVQELLRPRDDDGAGCAPEEVLDRTCDAGVLADDAFRPRPTGGSQLLEGSLEVRVPAFGLRSQAVAFLDFGQVWEEMGRVDPGDLRLTPGIGFRYYTPIGPIRVDVAYQLRSGERLQVVTTQVRPFDPERDVDDDRLEGADGRPVDYVRSDRLAVLEPRVLFDDTDPWSWRRLQLHLSLGQAF